MEAAKQELIESFIEGYGERIGDTNMLRSIFSNMSVSQCAKTIADYANKFDLEDSEEDLKEKFGALYNAFQFGAPPHAGMAPGVDRIVMLLADTETIRDVIAFPLNGNAQDVMMGAPGNVTEQQLREVHIKVRD